MAFSEAEALVSVLDGARGSLVTSEGTFDATVALASGSLAGTHDFLYRFVIVRRDYTPPDWGTH